LVEKKKVFAAKDTPRTKKKNISEI